ncbi:hypothetical protein IV38_GL002125 [Lactobacillus selangorensis]|uniref:YtxH domain-containing protein n=1 Tax=Lactobacillus selangorensis TaxID=81857 RepID=A0A0R2FS74_9LACO|nr:hypothetical protein [Lactobacillus selangorensis]KRN27472.1 hypothetical protein IV38_GL002125 [Lactobacillus selangorensis]KRN31331.1 hypothetical protein IV40_GL001325 [Lactobacillus selangorensis]
MAKKNKNHFVLGFILGGATTYLATLFLTPVTSDDIVKGVQQRFNSLKQQLSGHQDIQQNEKETLNNIQDAQDQLKKNVQDNLKKSTDAVRAQMDQVKQSADKLASDAAQAADEADMDDIVIDGKSAFGEAKDE